MANYACVSLRKLNSTSSLAGAYRHNYREESTPNVDPELSHLNDEAVKLKAANYVEAFNERLKSLEYYKDHKFRRDGVRAFELVLDYSPEAAGSFDVDAWKKANVEWLQKKFGEKNVVSVVFHYDEGVYAGSGAIHGHAIVIPEDSRGRICASSFIDGKRSLVELQDSYADAMKQFGLERGIRGQHASHKTIKQIYAKAAETLAKDPVPEKMRGESDRDYENRLKDRIEELKAASVRKDYLHEKEVRELKAAQQPESWKDKRISFLEAENSELKDGSARLEEQISARGDSVQEVLDKAESLDLLNYGVQNHPDRRRAAAVSAGARDMISWAQEHIAEREVEKS